MLGQTRGQGNSGDQTEMMMRGWWGWWGVSVWGLASSSRAVVIRSDSGRWVNKPFIIVIILESRTIHHPFSEHLCDEEYYAPTISFVAALLLSLCDASSRALTLTARPSHHYVSSERAVGGEPSHMTDVTQTRDTQWHIMLIRDLVEDDIEIAIKVSSSLYLFYIEEASCFTPLTPSNTTWQFKFFTTSVSLAGADCW